MPLPKVKSYPLTEAKDKFSALTAQANATGVPFRVLKGGKPWAMVTPISTETASDDRGSVEIRPIKRAVSVVDIDVLFSDYDGSYVPKEDGFSSSVGSEEM